MQDAISTGMAAPASDEDDAVQQRIAALLADPLLADVPLDVTLAEARALAALETGQAMRVTVVRLDGVRIGVLARLSEASTYLLVPNAAPVKGCTPLALGRLGSPPGRHGEGAEALLCARVRAASRMHAEH